MRRPKSEHAALVHLRLVRGGRNLCHAVSPVWTADPSAATCDGCEAMNLITKKEQKQEVVGSYQGIPIVRIQ